MKRYFLLQFLIFVFSLAGGSLGIFSVGCGGPVEELHPERPPYSFPFLIPDEDLVRSRYCGDEVLGKMEAEFSPWQLENLSPNTLARTLESFQCGCGNYAHEVKYWPNIVSIYGKEYPCSDLNTLCSDLHEDGSPDLGRLQTEMRKMRDYSLQLAPLGTPLPPQAVPAPGAETEERANEVWLLPECVARPDPIHVPAANDLEWVISAIALLSGRNVTVHSPACEVEVSKVFESEYFNSEFVMREMRRCLEERNYSADYEKEIIEGTFVPPLFGGAPFVQFNENQWPEVDICLQDVVNKYYQSDLRYSYERNGYEDASERECDYEAGNYGIHYVTEGDQTWCHSAWDNQAIDEDGDGVCSLMDTCPFEANPGGEQNMDADGDRIGASCDNCPNHNNPRMLNNRVFPHHRAAIQPDSDHDGIGDACDVDAHGNLCADTADADMDDVNDACDNCPQHYNPLPTAQLQQIDSDHDGDGDACDVCPQDNLNDCDGDTLCANLDPFPLDPQNQMADQDGDGIARRPPQTNCPATNAAVDNCPAMANNLIQMVLGRQYHPQQNSDGDAQGDLCDADDDNDGVLDATDKCPITSDPEQVNTDGDAQGDLCDIDDDNDSKLDGNDNCPKVSNRDQADRDQDGRGDACDNDNDDRDNDNVPNDGDNCPDTANQDQKDRDRDHRGDVCDNCPNVANAGWADRDNNGIGDACQDQAVPAFALTFRPDSPAFVNRDDFGVNISVEIGRFSLQGDVRRLQSLNYFIRFNGAVVVQGRANPNLGSIRWNGMVNASPASPGIYTLTLEASVIDQNNVPQSIPIETRFTIYQIRFAKVANALQQGGGAQANQDTPSLDLLSLYINNDDDNTNWTKDFLENNLNNENDLIGLRATIDPPLLGTMNINVENNLQNVASPSVKLWTSIQKQQALAPPLVYLPGTTFYIEGLSAVTSQQQVVHLAASFMAAQGNRQVALATKFLPLNLVQVDVVKDRDNNAIIGCDDSGIVARAENRDANWENCEIGLIDASNPPLDRDNPLRIGLWDHAYFVNDRNQLSVYNEADPRQNFIDRDSERFYVRIINPKRNQDPNVRERILANEPSHVEIATRVSGQGNNIFDDFTPTTLEETGNSTGVFVSRSQLLTTYDVLPLDVDYEENLLNCDGRGDIVSMQCSDDNFMVHDGFSGRVADDEPNDRTHKATVSDYLQIRYQPFPGIPRQLTIVPICLASELKTVHLRMFVFNELFLDNGVMVGDEEGGAPILEGAGDGQFTFEDRNGNGVCDCPDRDNNSTCDPMERECEPFADTFRQEGEQTTMDRGKANGRTVMSYTGVRGPVLDQARIQQMVDTANILWQQGCINVVMDEIRYINPPLEMLREEMQLVIDGNYDGMFLTFSSDEIYKNIFRTTLPRSDDILNTFVIPFLNMSVGFTLMPGMVFDDWSAALFVYAPDFSKDVLAHEIGHALTNQAHGDFDQVEGVLEDQPYFYPFGYSSPNGILLINEDRRVPRSVIQTIHRTPTDEDRSGNFILQNYVPIPHPQQ